LQLGLQWRVSTATRTRAVTAKPCKTSDELSPPLRQTARCALGGEGQQKNTLNILQNCISEPTKSNEFSAKELNVAKQKVLTFLQTVKVSQTKGRGAGNA